MISYRVSMAMAAVAAAMLITSCGGNSDDPDYVALTLAQSTVTVTAGESASVNITSGNDEYSVTSSAKDIATAVISGKTVKITGVKEGNSTVTVTDASKKTATIAVTVSAKIVDMVLDKTTVSMAEKAVTTVNITSGNGGYTVASSNADVVAAEINENSVVLTGKKAGTATVTVTDKAKKTATIDVTVTSLTAGADFGIGYGGGKVGTHAIVRIPIVHKYNTQYDFTHMNAVTMECLVKFSDFLPWQDNSTSNWLNTVMGNPDYFMIRLKYFDGEGYKLNAMAPGVEVHSGFVKAGEWHHIAFTFKNGAVNFYMDGVLCESGTANQDYIDLTKCNNLPKQDPNDAKSIYQYYDFFLGTYNGSRWLNGCMAEARLWKVARSADQIKASRLTVNTADETASYGLIGYWKLSGTGKTILKDYSGNSFDAELLGDNAFTKENVAVDYKY